MLRGMVSHLVNSGRGVSEQGSRLALLPAVASPVVVAVLCSHAWPVCRWCHICQLMGTACAPVESVLGALELAVPRAGLVEVGLATALSRQDDLSSLYRIILTLPQLS